MRKTFFILMFYPTADHYFPLMDTDAHGDYEKVSLFSSREKAQKEAEEHSACVAFGYQIFEIE